MFGEVFGLKNARNPVVEKLGQLCVPNDFFCGVNHEFTLITGINMSGKTTFIKTIALICIMAQIGYPVPCEHATITMRDSIFARIGSDDDLNTNCSTLLKEFQEINHCIRSISEGSLVLIDELGRGTSVLDGLGLSTAVCEFLIQKQVNHPTISLINV